MKRIKTRALALLLSCCLVTVGTIGSYQTAQAAEIVAGGALVGTLEEILLSFGIFLLPASMTDSAQNSDWWYSEDGNAALKPYYEDLATEYEKERFKVINGGGNKPQPSPTPEPGTTPEVTPVPTGDIPTFDELVAPALAGGAIAWANGAFDVMGKAVSNLWNKMIGIYDSSAMDFSDLDDTTQDLINKNSDSFPYYVYTEYHWNDGSYGTVVTKQLTFLGKGSCVGYISSYGELYVYHVGHCENYRNDYNKGVESPLSLYMTMDPKTYKRQYYAIDGKTGYRTNLPIFQNENDAMAYVNEFLSTKENYTKESIWVHPDLQNTYQNNGKFEYPAQAPQPLQYPSSENLADLAKKLNPEINPDYSPEIAPNYVQELIQKLQKNPSVNPDPDPNPNPNPDPGTDPQPTLAPNPTGTPEQPENPEDEVKPYTADLKDVFPFCIPFDLIHLFEVFDADPEAPVFEIPIDLQVDNPFTGASIVSYKDTIKIDLSDYEEPIKVIRVFEVIFFLIGLMLITRSHMIKG